MRDMWDMLKKRNLVDEAETIAQKLCDLLDGYCIVCHRPSYSTDLAEDCLNLVCKSCYYRLLDGEDS